MHELISDTGYRVHKRLRLSEAFDSVSDSVYVRTMGRPPLNVKPTMVRLADDVRQRIEALVGARRMAIFIREAIENELKRRERRGTTARSSNPAELPGNDAKDH